MKKIKIWQAVSRREVIHRGFSEEIILSKEFIPYEPLAKIPILSPRTK